MPLGARAWIADGERGALVARDGTIDWWCPERVDAEPACWRLLDPSGTAVRVGPVRDGTGATRRLPPGDQGYLEGSNVARTRLAGPGGRQVEVIDALPWTGPHEAPPGRIVRIVRALAGPVDVEVEVVVGTRAAPAVSAGEEALVTGELAVQAGMRLRPEPVGRDTPRWRGVRRLAAGEVLVVTLDRAGPEGRGPLSVDAAHRVVDQTAAAWRSWLSPVAYDGPYRRAVERSLLALRGLTGRGGAPAGAGTTSLPRRAGTDRTADDRSVRVRDAAMAAGVLARAGLGEDAEAAEAWLRTTLADAPQPWPGAFGPDGQPVPALEERPLAGWRHSQPVVAGRPERLDLDLYGDVVGAVDASTRPGPTGGDRSGGAPAARGGPGPLRGAWAALADGADWLAEHWADPDAGVWECGGPARRLVASRLQAWRALDRMARLARVANPLDLQAVAWQQAAAEVLAWCEANGLAAGGGLRREPTPGDEPDAALLRIAWAGPWPPGHPVVERTVERVLAQLGTGPFLSRYPAGTDDGHDGQDSPDLLATLWAVRALAALGRWDGAHERMEAVVALGGDLGLLGEAADPLSGELLGNLPAAAVHLALVDAALALAAGPR